MTGDSSDGKGGTVLVYRLPRHQQQAHRPTTRASVYKPSANSSSDSPDGTSLFTVPNANVAGREGLSPSSPWVQFSTTP